MGVCASVLPYNFPVMTGLLVFPLAVVTGNTVVLKPSEKVNGSTGLLCDLFSKAGAPPGVLNAV
jgi:malonate-semialdehyde dehydrogenase (acetylating)/methylmalonate-semialdehyde dehydrogenase